MAASTTLAASAKVGPCASATAEQALPPGPIVCRGPWRSSGQLRWRSARQASRVAAGEGRRPIAAGVTTVGEGMDRGGNAGNVSVRTSAIRVVWCGTPPGRPGRTNGKCARGFQLADEAAQHRVRRRGRRRRLAVRGNSCILPTARRRYSWPTSELPICPGGSPTSGRHVRKRGSWTRAGQIGIFA
jgi:hypothetical protein